MKHSMLKLLVLLMMVTSKQLIGQDGPPPPPPNGKDRAKIEAARAAVISQRLELTPEQAEKFWPVYNEFSKKREDLRREFFDARRNAGEGQPDDEQQRKLVNLGIEIRQRELNLEKDYSGRLMKVISAQQMLKLHGAERDFQQMVMHQLQQRRNMQQRKEHFRDKNQQLRQRRN